VSPDQDRRWPWYHQIEDAITAALGVAITVTMLIRDSWPVIGVVFALVCLGKLSSTTAIRYLIGRWEQDHK